MTIRWSYGNMAIYYSDNPVQKLHPNRRKHVQLAEIHLTDTTLAGSDTTATPKRVDFVITQVPQ